MVVLLTVVLIWNRIKFSESLDMQYCHSIHHYRLWGLSTRRKEEGSLYFQAQYWVFPAHYVFESMTMSMYHLDYRMVEVGPGSQYYDDLGCNDSLINGRCLVPVNEYVTDAFCK